MDPTAPRKDQAHEVVAVVTAAPKSFASYVAFTATTDTRFAD